MRCLVLVCIAACVSTASAAAASCLAEDFFKKHNISADDSHEPGLICGGQCCGRGREGALRTTLRRNAEDTIAAATRPIAELLLATRRTLQEHLTALSQQSQNKTAVLFSQLYRSHATRAHAPLATLYDDIRTLLRSNPEIEDTDGVDLGSPPPKEMAQSTKKFFREVFPVAYQNVLRLDAKQFTPEYEACLKDAYDAVQPFGEVPQQLGSSLSKSLEAARALLQVLAVGAGALTASEQVVNSNEECSNKLLRLAGCSRCKGFEVSPCRNYCLNVARGCIGSMVSELDAPWAGYVEGVERLARADADAALRALDARVSEAIMHALENHVILEKKVRQECGPPSTLDTPSTTSPQPTSTASRRDALRAPPPDTELLQFAATLAASKKLFAGLADGLCDDTDFAADSNEHCWNGESIGDYTKALVASASISDQKYNPEVSTEMNQNSKIAVLGDRLRQARQLLVKHSWSAPAAEAFMQGDEAGDEGSGSGRLYTDDDASYDTEGSGEEGSGSHDIAEGTVSGEEKTYSAPPKINSGASTMMSFGLTTVVLLSSISRL
ncbi:division abnormally delayed protein [Zerene cesonia]|uniref:division abnormally delayed protein n=1 Tax=Zerene cesonia TaxID=33412 RepID=UPI0018E5233B|nr:division abnormally delayed protein [Zerene cesonia]